MRIECEREQDVLDALAARRWPARCDTELAAHVAACPVCTDLVEVAGALLDDHDVTYRDARIPSSGVVWWRAQLRARDEDARAAARPIAFIQGVAASVALWLLVTLLRAVPSATVAAWTREQSAPTDRPAAVPSRAAARRSSPVRSRIASLAASRAPP